MTTSRSSTRSGSCPSRPGRRQTADGDTLYLTFDAPPRGSTFAVTADASVAETSQIGRTGSVQVLVDDAPAASVQFQTFLWLVTRIVGRSTLGELSSFQLILFIAVGDLIQQSVVVEDDSVTAALLAVGTFALLTVVSSWANVRWPRVRPVTHGEPVIVVQHGDPRLEVLRGERLALDDLIAAARQQGIERIGDIRLAVLEANGQISFFTSSGQDAGAESRPDLG